MSISLKRHDLKKKGMMEGESPMEDYLEDDKKNLSRVGNKISIGSFKK
jgi:hypothetical protein